MRGASAAAVETLTGVLDSVVADGADAAKVADDLFGVAGILQREPGLRRVLTDVSVEPEARSALVGSVFEGKLDKASLELASKAAGMRWASTNDLGRAMEQLGVLAVVKGADKADEGDRIQDDLFALTRLVQTNHDLRDALGDPARSDDDKRSLLRGLLEGKVTTGAIRLAEQALAGSHHTVVGALEDYQQVASQGRTRLLATVRVARPLSDDDKARLEQALAAKYDRPMHTNVVVDPEILGGIRIEIGDDVIDGTILSRLDNARRQLAG
jgi:F-type H+-transporting ATPase subunit delta